MKYVPVDVVEAAVENFYSHLQLSRQRIASIKSTVLHELSIEGDLANQEIARQTKTLHRLETERQKVLQAHYTDAIPIDLMKAEMARITREQAEAETRIHACQGQPDAVICQH